MRILAYSVLGLLAFAGVAAAQRMSPDEQRAMVEDYCLMCHSDVARTGGLTLESFDPRNLEEHRAVAEKMIRKLRTGMMPPSYAVHLYSR